MDMLVNSQSAIVCSASSAMSATNHHILSESATNDYDGRMHRQSHQDMMEERRIWIGSPTKRIRLALDLIVRLVLLPFIDGVTRRLRRVRGLNLLLLHNVQHSRRIITNLLAYAANTMSLNLSAVHVAANRIDPLLRLIKLRAPYSPPQTPAAIADANCISIPDDDATAALPSTTPLQTTPSVPVLSASQLSIPERSVTLNVLAAPPAGQPIRADVVFIHGLHGSLVNTWKQGRWSSDGRRVSFQRPPRPPVRPPKRQRHSRGNHFTEAAPPRSKRPKIATRSCMTQSCPTTPSAERADINDRLESYFSEWRSKSVDLDDAEHRRWDDVDDDDVEDDVTSAESIDEACSVDESYSDIDELELLEQFPAFRLRDEVISESTVPEDDDEDHDENLQNNDNEAAREVHKNTASNPKEPNEDDDTTEDDNYSRCWPGDWLPLDCPGVRVIAVNYTTDPYLWRPLWVRKTHRTTLAQRAREMTELLVEQGIGEGGRPIVWVGHSKGGIFIKQIIVDAWESGKALVAPLWRSARGCLFYSVPHRGSPLADFNLPLVRQSVELVEIKKNSPGVLELHRRFVALYRSGHLRVQIFSFVETALTLMSVLYLRIVGIDSADPGIGEVCGVHLDHREICKPRDRNCILYTKLKKMINQVS